MDILKITRKISSKNIKTSVVFFNENTEWVAKTVQSIAPEFDDAISSCESYVVDQFGFTEEADIYVESIDFKDGALLKVGSTYTGKYGESKISTPEIPFSECDLDHIKELTNQAKEFVKGKRAQLTIDDSISESVQALKDSVPEGSVMSFEHNGKSVVVADKRDAS